MLSLGIQQLSLLVLQHHHLSFFTFQLFLNLVELCLKNTFLGSQRLLILELEFHVLVKEKLILAVITNPSELVGLFIFPFLSQMLHTSRFMTETAI